MSWNWKLPEWPHFHYASDKIAQLEREFQIGVERASACLQTMERPELQNVLSKILPLEIGGERNFSDKESLQLSIREYIELHTDPKKEKSRTAPLLSTLYESFRKPLTHEMLWGWHTLLFSSSPATVYGRYRTQAAPMLLISAHCVSPRLLFEALPSERVPREMDLFMEWFNGAGRSESVLGQAALAHLYFETIHPFEDGNGRIGRLLVEKILSQRVGKPIWIPVSKVLDRKKKDYLSLLETTNRTLAVDRWVGFFARLLFEAHQEALQTLYFLLEQAQRFLLLSEHLNPRQIGVWVKIVGEGPTDKGVSGEEYSAITKTTWAPAAHDLTDLVKKGVLVKKGRGRHAHYFLR